MKSIAHHLLPPADGIWIATNPAIGPVVAYVVGEHAPSPNEPDLVDVTACHDEIAKRRAINNLRVLGLRNVRAVSPAEWQAMKRKMGSTGSLGGAA
jgi:hypothetical protein